MIPHCLPSLFFEDGVDFPTTRGLVIIDAFPNVGTMLEGFVVASQQCNIPMQYVALLADEQHTEWFTAYWHDDLVGRFQKGSLQVPGMERPKINPKTSQNSISPSIGIWFF